MEAAARAVAAAAEIPARVEVVSGRQVGWAKAI
jgi:hypothetical protein